MSQFNHTISAILRGRWMIQQEWAESHLPLIVSMIEGKPVSFVERVGDSDFELPFCIDPKTMDRHNLWIRTPDCRLVKNPNIPPNSVGILPINSPITKYDGSCGEPGMITKTNWLLDMDKRDNIGSVVELYDTPGGEMRASTGYLAVKLKMKKPILGFIDDLSASMGVMFSSACDEVYASHDLADIGSVGGYVTYADYTGYFEKLGIKLTSIYAPQSTDKNGTYRKVMANDPEGEAEVKEDLRVHVAQFISFVADQRGDKAKSNIKEWNTGKMFKAKDATKLGLIDGVKPFDQVVSKAAWLATRK
jgi:protease-4